MVAYISTEDNRWDTKSERKSHNQQAITNINRKIKMTTPFGLDIVNQAPKVSFQIIEPSATYCTR